MGTELYVYWKVGTTQLPQALAAAQALQQLLMQRHPALQARLLQRADGADGSATETAANGTPPGTATAAATTTTTATLMEIYSQPGGIGGLLRQDIESHAKLQLAALGPPAVQRHIELFEPR